MMPEKDKEESRASSAKFSRRAIFKTAGLAAIAGTAGCAATERAPEPRIPLVDYASIGVRPFINCKGTYTRLSGSLMLPEVKAAMIAASEQYVELDELMDAVGQRLHELTGAEWGMITAGCNAAQFGSACACAAGADPEKMALLPDTTGMKNEMITPRRHRNVYDRAFLMAGMKMLTADSIEDMESKITDKTAMLPILGDQSDRGEILLEDIVRLGRKHNIPVFVDAAAERPDVPNRYIEAGCDLVAYSGGKCLRGPQSSGIMIGRKDLCKAAFLNLAPHHALGRPMKCGKEEIMAALAAMDLWINGRDHDAEWKEWLRRFDYITTELSSIPSLTTTVIEPTMLSNDAPNLAIDWDADSVNVAPAEMVKQLEAGTPRIKMNASRTGMRIMAYMMEDGDEIHVAKRMKEVLSAAL